MLISVIVRTYNEERYLLELLESINNQHSDIFDVEIVVVDSGSTDKTLAIAKKCNARITHIRKEDFSFGRSLNIGCEYARGEIFVFVSGHCIPVGTNWIHNLCMPIYDGIVQYSYGKQLGRDTTKFSEGQVFEKYFPNDCMIPQSGFFCNNANAALLASSWRNLNFDEDLTGLEDMHLARQLQQNGGHIGYVSTAAVFHIHDETWPQVKRRYEREAIALQKISPEIHISLYDFINCLVVSCFSDLKIAVKRGVLLRVFTSVIMFRFFQYWGSYSGNHIHRKLSYESKRKYFYPNEVVTTKLVRENSYE